MSIIPRYLAIADLLQKALETGRLKAGQVLTEEPLARHFDTSRTTIRKALATLHDGKMITRFDGRGFLVGTDSSVAPLRDSIEGLLFDLANGSSVPRAISNPDQILPILREELIRSLPFGPMQINEAQLTQRFSVSRSVVREMLSRLRSSGIVEKSARSKWVLPVLTASDVRNHYQMRILLEPVALVEAAPHLSKSDLKKALAKIQMVNQKGDEPDGATLADLENSLHVWALSCCGNEHLLRALQKSRLVLAVNEMFRLLINRCPDSESLINEHIKIFEALLQDEWTLAASLLESHLVEARERTCKRLQTLSVLAPPEMPSYLGKEAISIHQLAR